MSNVLVDHLIEREVITPEQRQRAAQHAAQRGISEVQAIVALEFATANQIREIAAVAAGAQISTDLALEKADPEATGLLTSRQARNWRVIPLRFDGDVVVLAASASVAADASVNDNVRLALPGRRYRWLLATDDAITAKLNAEYRAEAELSSISELAADGTEDAGALASRFVRLILTQAAADRASDIHVEPGERDVSVRFRIDGVLLDKPSAAKSIQNAVINQLKIMANLDIGEQRVPQDGRITETVDGRRLDLRVACLPTVWGEKIVMRILDNTATRRSLHDFTFSPDNERKFRSAFTKPHGMILVTGPTGSGKSTTLYATLNELNRPEVNIITVEDPVEYKLPRINQVQVNVKAGMTFAAALRTILRADPDIVLIGEIRDKETAKIAVEAAQTGHLVLTTLHTNNAPESPARLIEMGVEPFLVATVLECVVAQRLVRRLCECKTPYIPTADELAQVNFRIPESVTPTFFQKAGCAKCSGTGYSGRFAVQEVLNRNGRLERAIAEARPSDDMVQIAEETGMVPLREDGWLKVAQGLTTIDEVLRVVA